MGGSPDIEYPEPTPEERDLQKEQTELLRQQREILLAQSKQGQMILPVLLKDAGFLPKFDAQGNITSIEESNDPATTLRKEIETGLLQRTQAALKGELPVNPALVGEISDQEKTLRETLLKELGPGFETSTAGIKALGEFGERKTQLLESARRDDLTLAEQLGIARTGLNRQVTSQAYNSIAGVPGNMQGIASTVQGFNSPLNWFQQNRQGQFQADSMNAQLRSQTMGQIFGGLGMLGGVAAGKWIR